MSMCFKIHHVLEEGTNTGNVFSFQFCPSLVLEITGKIREALSVIHSNLT